MFAIDKDLIQDYIGIEIEVFLSNHLKYTGKILEIRNGTIVFLDKYEKKVLINVESVISVNPRRGYDDEDRRIKEQ